MSSSQAPEPALSVQGDSTAATGHEDAAEDNGTQHSHRMLSFSDALLSIIATVMILPVAHTEISPEQFDQSIQRLLANRIAVYLMTFLIVTVAWAAHTRLFQVVGKIDDTLALLNLACMMTITFLPFTFSLMVAFPKEPLGIILFCACVIAIGAVQALIVVYAFRLPHLLIPQIGRSGRRGHYQRHILHIVLRGPALCLLAAGFSLFFYPVSYLLMATVIFLPYISKAAGWCQGRLLGPRELLAPSVELFTFDLQEALSKERVEAFSDGVYAIVATLLILDICEDVPNAKDVEEKFQGSLVAALSVGGPQFLAYFGSFATVGLLWFAHHSLFLHVRRPTQFMGLLNALSLAFVGGLPLAYQQTSALAEHPRDELESVRVSCAIVFFASVFQLAMWTAALLHQAETLRPAAHFGGQEHAFMCAKLALYPCASLLAFTLTCVLSQFSTVIFHSMQIAVPFAFLLLRLLVRLARALLRALLRGPAPAPPGTPQSPRPPCCPPPAGTPPPEAEVGPAGPGGCTGLATGGCGAGGCVVALGPGTPRPGLAHPPHSGPHAETGGRRARCAQAVLCRPGRGCGPCVAQRAPVQSHRHLRHRRVDRTARPRHRHSSPAGRGDTGQGGGCSVRVVQLWQKLGGTPEAEPNLRAAAAQGPAGPDAGRAGLRVPLGLGMTRAQQPRPAGLRVRVLRWQTTESAHVRVRGD